MKHVLLALTMAWKEIQLIARDRSWLAMLFLLPLLIGGLMGGINVQMSRPGEATILLRVCLVQQDTGAFGAQVAKTVQTIRELKVETFGTVAEAEQRVATGEAAAAIIIPADFSQKIDAYTPTAVQVIVDPAQRESAGIVTGIMNQVVAEVVVWGEVQHGIRTVLDESGVLASASLQTRRAVEAQNLGVIMTQLAEMRRNPAIGVVNEDLAGARVEGGGVEQFFALLFPGLAVMFAFFIVAMAGTSLLNERETGTLRRILASPIPRGAIITGKMLAFMLLACLQVAVLLGVANLLFGMPLGRSPLTLVALTVAVAFVATALGMLIAAVAQSARQADSAGILLSFVLAGISGAIPISLQEPIFRSAGFIGTLAKLTPHAYAIEGYYRVMAENAPFAQVLPEIGILLAMGLIFFVIALWRFRYE